jgi:hypothetical protein
MTLKQWCVLLYLCICGFIVGYKPVIMQHGIGGYFFGKFLCDTQSSGSNFIHLAERIEKLHPGTKTFSLYVDDRFWSFRPLCVQVKNVIHEIHNLQKLHNFTEFHLIGHSQGKRNVDL